MSAPPDSGASQNIKDNINPLPEQHHLPQLIEDLITASPDIAALMGTNRTWSAMRSVLATVARHLGVPLDLWHRALAHSPTAAAILAEALTRSGLRNRAGFAVYRLRELLDHQRSMPASRR
jgi:hypothetical protein